MIISHNSRNALKIARIELWAMQTLKGLYIPSSIPKISYSDMCRMIMSFLNRSWTSFQMMFGIIYHGKLLIILNKQRIISVTVNDPCKVLSRNYYMWLWLQSPLTTDNNLSKLGPIPRLFGGFFINNSRIKLVTNITVSSHNSTRISASIETCFTQIVLKMLIWVYCERPFSEANGPLKFRRRVFDRFFVNNSRTKRVKNMPVSSKNSAYNSASNDV